MTVLRSLSLAQDAKASLSGLTTGKATLKQWIPRKYIVLEE